MNVKWDLESFHRRLTTTRFPKFDNTKIKLTTTERCPKNGNLTGFASEVNDNYLTEDERKMIEEYLQDNTAAANDYFWHLQEKYPYKVFYILAPVTFKW